MDPLTAWFELAKVAEQEAPSPGEPRRLPLLLKKDSPDPGERALIGILGASGSFLSKAVPFLGRAAINMQQSKHTVPWMGPPAKGPTMEKAIDDFIQMGGARPGAPFKIQNKVLGLFDVAEDYPSIPTQLEDSPVPGFSGPDEYFQKHWVPKIEETKEVADSFIKRYGLEDKGVTLRFQKGPLSGLGGGAYVRPTREVYLPYVSKERALHELGHAADFTTPTGRFRSIVSPALSRGTMIALPIAMAAGDEIKRLLPGTMDDKAIEFMQQNAPAIMGATLAATTLYPEAKASILAVKHLRELERAGKQLPGTAATAAKRLLPTFGTYLLGAIPAIVGMSLAKKYMNEARAENEKTASISSRLWQLLPMETIFRGVGIGQQIASQSMNLISSPGTLRRVGSAAKEVGTSPEFIYGALGAGVPAALGSLYLYATPSGEVMRKRLPEEAHIIEQGRAGRIDEEWKEQHPLRFASLVGAGAALSGGILSKFITDLKRVL
jgi:hypothetical protein